MVSSVAGWSPVGGTMKSFWIWADTSPRMNCSQWVSSVYRQIQSPEGFHEA